MSPKEKAQELYDTFTVQDFNPIKGFFTNIDETKNLAKRSVEQIELQAKNWGVNSVRAYWVEVKKEIENL